MIGWQRHSRTDFCLVLCSECAVLIERYAETRSSYEWGLVCHAFSGAMREILEDWKLLVTQLEHQYLTNGLNLQASPSSKSCTVHKIWTDFWPGCSDGSVEDTALISAKSTVCCLKHYGELLLRICDNKERMTCGMNQNMSMPCKSGTKQTHS